MPNHKEVTITKLKHGLLIVGLFTYIAAPVQAATWETPVLVDVGTARLQDVVIGLVGISINHQPKQFAINNG